MSITAAEFNEAASILEEGTSARSTLPATDGQYLNRLSMEVYIARWGIGTMILQPILDWILDHIGPFQDWLDQLAGDAVAIQQHANVVRSVGAEVGSSLVMLLQQAADLASRVWLGPAQTLFAETITAMIRNLVAYAALADTIANAEVAVGDRTGAVRQVITDIARHLMTELVNGAVIIARNVALALVVPIAGWLFAAKALAEFVLWAGGFVVGYLNQALQVVQSFTAQVTGVMGQVAGLGSCLDRAASVLEGKGDPGPPGQVAPGSVADQARGTQPQQADLDVANLVDDFPEGDGDIPPNTRVYPPVQKPGESDADYAARVGTVEDELRAMGIDPALFTDEANGFAAGLYVDDKGRYTITFAGTDFSARNDVVEDAIGGATVSPQSQNAIALANAVQGSSIADDTIYAGHSLGGRLASVASMTSGNPAITFNSAGVSPATVAYLAQQNGMTTEQMYANLESGQVRGYQTADDLLTNLQEHYPTAPGMPDAVGHQIPISGGASNPIDGHLMPNVLEEMKKTGWF